ncbi:hypothetical protein ACWGQ5_34995 [Streptomyces sp. NPDC055722]
MGLIAVQVAAAHVPARLVGVEPRAAARALSGDLGADEHTRRRSPAPTHTTSSSSSPERRPDSGRLLNSNARTARCASANTTTAAREMDIELWHRGVAVVNGFTPQRHRQLAALREGLRFAAERRLTLEPLLTHEVALDDLAEGFALLHERPSGFVKGVLRPANHKSHH